MEEDSVMDYPISNTTRVFPPLIFDVGNKGDHQMEQLTKRVEQLEKTTQWVQKDVAILLARSEYFATKVGLEVLTARLENFATKADLECVKNELKTEQAGMRVEILGELGKLENRIDKKFEKMDLKFDKQFEKVDQKFDSLNDRLTWSIMVPAVAAILIWFVKDIVLKI